MAVKGSAGLYMEIFAYLQIYRLEKFLSRVDIVRTTRGLYFYFLSPTAGPRGEFLMFVDRQCIRQLTTLALFRSYFTELEIVLLKKDFSFVAKNNQTTGIRFDKVCISSFYGL